MTKTKLSKKDAIKIILTDTAKYLTTLNYAVNYCTDALKMDEDSEAFDIQVLYILNNLAGWRHPQAKQVRQTLRAK